MRYFRLTFHPIVLACLILCLLGGLSADAAAKKNTVSAPPDPRILIVAVVPADKQITVILKRTGQKTVYTVDDLTQITFQNNPGSFSDIKVGQQIFTYAERDAHTLDSLTIGPADPAPTAPPPR